MTKTEAIDIFGGTKECADALGITRHAIYMWPEVLTQATTDRVIGAAVRGGMAEKVREFNGAAA